MLGFRSPKCLLLRCVAGMWALDFCSYEFGWKGIWPVQMLSEVASLGEICAR